MGEIQGEKRKGKAGSQGREEAPPEQGGNPSPCPNHRLKERDQTGWMKQRDYFEKRRAVIKNSFVCERKNQII